MSKPNTLVESTPKVIGFLSRFHESCFVPEAAIGLFG